MRGGRGVLASPGLWFALALSGSGAYGVEQWRRNAARRATQSERARLNALVTCLLGRDGPTLVYDPGAARARLRRLAMETSLSPSPTWMDRCLPLARELAREGARVDVTRAPTRETTHVADRARDLTRAMSRVGLVWQVRAGDTEADFAHLASLLARTAAEIDLAGAPPAAADPRGPRAPELPALPGMLGVEVAGLQPLPLGDGATFLVGAPLPTLSRVRVRGHRATVEVLANDDARAWRLRPNGLVRLLAEDGRADGLAPLRVTDVDGTLDAGRMASPPPGVALSGISLDAASWGRAMWFAHAIRGNPPALARAPSGSREPTTAALILATRGDGASRDDEVAVGSDGTAVYAARTEHDATGPGVAVDVVRARGGARATVSSVTAEGGPWRLSGAHPGLAMCASRATLWVAATARDGWRVGTLAGDLLRTAHVVPAEGRRFDEIPTARCSPAGALLYGRDRPRASPTVWCADGGRCVTLPRWSPAQPAVLPEWGVTDAQGNRRGVPEWPLRVTRSARGTFVAARAAGTLVAVARLTDAHRAWSPERVVFDAADATPGATVQDIELYADAARITLVVTTASELRVAVSFDEGATWQVP